MDKGNTARVVYNDEGPNLGGDDINGGIYTPLPGEQFGLAGWSPKGATGSDGTGTRQVAFFDTLGIHHYPGLPDHTTGVADGQYWLRNLTDYVTWPGDSGSPIFIRHADGSREVFGVLSGTTTMSNDDIDCGGTCALYVDITRGAPKEWLLNVVQDNTRSTSWLSFHNKQDLWFGEVDYTGPCQNANDFDCDGWYDGHDYCPQNFNPDQIEGEACPAPPAPPGPIAVSCTSAYTCKNVGFGFPDLLIQCPSVVDFYQFAGTPNQTFELSSTQFLAYTNDVPNNVAACNTGTSGSTCTYYSTYTTASDYCGKLPPTPPPPTKCNNIPQPTSKCAAGWHCCGSDGWNCGLCQ